MLNFVYIGKKMNNMGLENTRPSDLNNKIALLFVSIIACIPLMLFVVAWLSQYISILSVVVVIVPFWIYTRWAMDKISTYNWQLTIIEDMKRRIWARY